MDDLHDEAPGGGLVNELDLPPLDEQELVWPPALAKKRPSRRVVPPGGKAAKRLHVVCGQPFEVLLRHGRA